MEIPLEKEKTIFASMKTDRILFIALLLFSSQTLAAQKYVTQSNADSTVLITKDQRLDDLIKKQKEINLQKQTIPGYRIQIFFGANRPKATEVKVDFNSKHPEVASYITYQQPNFKIRVGDFRTRLEAQKFLKAIEGQYATSFIVQDDIKLPPLK
jgi:hypothetical protein